MCREMIEMVSNDKNTIMPKDKEISKLNTGQTYNQIDS